MKYQAYPTKIQDIRDDEDDEQKKQKLFEKQIKEDNFEIRVENRISLFTTFKEIFFPFVLYLRKPNVTNHHIF